uniref:FBD domain-containing protein n=1 Tax=Chenopodium quinoa TaxID=63459 RepID=A0A803M4R0_CHEQI
MFQALEVLKIDVNLGLHQASTMPSFRLPNLKLLYLFGTVINDHGFLPSMNEVVPCTCGKGTLEEQEFFKKTLAVTPSCCRSHLKRIEIDEYYGKEREVNMIVFLLRHAFVLEKLILSKGYQSVPVANEVTLTRALQNLPRASATCSIEFRIRKQPHERFRVWWRAGC